MLLNFDELIERYGLKIKGIVHVGAHLAEEAEDYARHGIERVYWIEANPLVFGKLMQNLFPYLGRGHDVIQALISNQDDVETPFHVTNYDGMSSSVHQFGTHPNFSPDTVFVDHLTLKSTTLDTLDRMCDFDANMLVMDIQGHEGPAVQGAAGLLTRMDYVMSEVNKDEVYIGCTKIDELDNRLATYGFERVETFWVGDQGWGDALWVR